MLDHLARNSFEFCFLRPANLPNKSGARIGKVLRVDDIASTPFAVRYQT
jgi:hypothetical protein